MIALVVHHADASLIHCIDLLVMSLAKRRKFGSLRRISINYLKAYATSVILSDSITEKADPPSVIVLSDKMSICPPLLGSVSHRFYLTL